MHKEPSQRIAYIYFLINGASFGVREKVRQQSIAFNKVIKIFVINPTLNIEEAGITYLKFNSIDLFNVIFRKFKIIESLINLSNYDRVIIRYPGSDKSAIGFVKKHKNIIFEIHSKIIDELNLKISNTKNLFRKALRRIRYSQEKKYSVSILNQSKGIIVVHRGLRVYYKELLRNDLPIAVIANATNVNEVEFTKFKALHEELNFVFIGSRPDPWHGLDRLIVSIADYLKLQDAVQITLHIIGNIDKEKLLKLYDSLPLSFVKFHGVKYGKELNEIMSEMTLAICPLSLYKLNQQCTSSLKTCEYLARGIPILIGNNDENLFDEETSQFYYKVSNDNSKIKISELVTFIYNISNSAEDFSKAMRRYAEKKVDWSLKLKEFVEFCRVV